MLVKYFKQQGDRWQIDAGLRGRVKFRAFNLLEDPTSLGTLRRHVLPQRADLFRPADQDHGARKLHRILAPDGFLYLGGAETVLGISDKFQAAPEHRGIYRPASAASAQPRKVAV